MLSRHHICPSSKNGSNHPDNIEILDHKVHQKLHALFQNMLFHEQVDFLQDIAYTALDPRFRKDLKTVMQDYAGGYYRKHVLKNGIYIPREEEVKI